MDPISFILLIFLTPLIILLVKWKKERKRSAKLALENQKLLAANAALEVEHLKFQLQPHTLRNMVGTLHVAAKNLYRGSEALAETLDYVLYHGNKHMVSIAEEISFLESYKALQGNFINQIDSIKIDDSEVDTKNPYYHLQCVPHLISAYFIENAFKHGDITHPNFLFIKMKLQHSRLELLVVNRIKPKPTDGKGGLGLSNMRKRLDLLLGGKYQITSNQIQDEFHSTLVINF